LIGLLILNGSGLCVELMSCSSGMLEPRSKSPQEHRIPGRPSGQATPASWDGTFKASSLLAVMAPMSTQSANQQIASCWRLVTIGVSSTSSAIQLLISTSANHTEVTQSMLLRLSSLTMTSTSSRPVAKTRQPFSGLSVREKKKKNNDNKQIKITNE